MKPILMLVLVFGPALFLIFISVSKCEHKFQSLPEYGNIGEYKFTNSEGEIVSHETQKDKITLFTTIQTSCPEQCAIDLAKFNLLLYQDYRKNQKKLGHVKFVSIVTDSKGNPVRCSRVSPSIFLRVQSISKRLPAGIPLHCTRCGRGCDPSISFRLKGIRLQFRRDPPCAP